MKHWLVERKLTVEETLDESFVPIDARHLVPKVVKRNGGSETYAASPYDGHPHYEPPSNSLVNQPATGI